MKIINVTPIVKRYYCTLWDDRRNPLVDLLVLLGLPTGLALLGLVRPISIDFINTIVRVIAILFGFTFNALVIMSRYSTDGSGKEQKAIETTRTSTLYGLLVSLICLVIAGGITLFNPDFAQISAITHKAISYIVYLFFFHYGMTLLVLIRRLYILAEGGAFEDTGLSEKEVETIREIVNESNHCSED